MQTTVIFKTDKKLKEAAQKTREGHGDSFICGIKSGIERFGGEQATHSFRWEYIVSGSQNEDSPVRALGSH